VVACKLHEHGFSRIKAFTYGPPRNSQSLVAARVAEVLGLDWCEIPFDVTRMREIFHSEQRGRYQRFADGLSSVPTMGAFCPFLQLDCEQPDEVVVINGQTGDFISGNHLPPHLVGPAADDALWEHIRAKHFGIRPHGTADLQPIEERFRSWCESTTVGRGLENPGATRHENWEYRERQAKYVVNGQRLYEYLGMDWLLPWWDFELVRFFERVPVEDYLGRNFLLEYLRRYDYKGLFTENFPTPTAFTGVEGRLWESGLRIVGSQLRVPEVARRVAFYRCGYYRNYFALYPFDEYMRRSRGTVVDPQARCATGLMIDQWFEDQGFSQALPAARADCL
jgi:asparagine synthase (glutamine-hydrolysing)